MYGIHSRSIPLRASCWRRAIALAATLSDGRIVERVAVDVVRAALSRIAPRVFCGEAQSQGRMILLPRNPHKFPIAEVTPRRDDLGELIVAERLVAQRAAFRRPLEPLVLYPVSRFLTPSANRLTFFHADKPLGGTLLSDSFDLLSLKGSGPLSVIELSVSTLNLMVSRYCSMSFRRIATFLLWAA